MTTKDPAHPGNVSNDERTSVTCNNSHAATKYITAILKTFRRLSSSKKDIIVVVQAIFPRES